jgi:hypothetical protein
MNSLSVIVDKFECSQLCYSIGQWFNKLIEEGNIDCVLFCKELDKPFMQTNFSIMNISELYSFSGLVVSTNIENTKQLINCCINADKVFYIWDLEFIGNKNYTDNLSVFRNEEINLVTRSEDYADEIENFCNKRPLVIEDFNLPEIYNGFFTRTQKQNYYSIY